MFGRKKRKRKITSEEDLDVIGEFTFTGFTFSKETMIEFFIIKGCSYLCRKYYYHKMPEYLYLTHSESFKEDWKRNTGSDDYSKMPTVAKDIFATHNIDRGLKNYFNRLGLYDSFKLTRFGAQVQQYYVLKAGLRDSDYCFMGAFQLEEETRPEQQKLKFFW